MKHGWETLITQGGARAETRVETGNKQNRTSAHGEENTGTRGITRQRQDRHYTYMYVISKCIFALHKIKPVVKVKLCTFF